MKTRHRYVSAVASAFNFKSVGVYMIYGVVVGVVAGLGAVLFYVMCQTGMHFLLDMIAGQSAHSQLEVRGRRGLPEPVYVAQKD